MFVIVAAFILRYLIGTLNPGLGVQRPEIEAWQATASRDAGILAVVVP